ncbi:hypothetical protein P8452_49809 [Trifolium repens]|nr:hypothetical protein P8452_49809 [Trifolium repens]
MGSSSRGKDGEGTSGINRVEDDDEQEMNFVPSQILFLNSSNMNTNGFVAPFVMQQVPMSGMQRPGGMMAQPHLMQNRYVETVVHERYKTVRITWIHGGTNVVIAGTWNNWETAEALHNVGENSFVIDKTLPIGIYYYRFIVDGHWRHAPEFPSHFDGFGAGYNILDLQDYIPQRAENEAEDPSSPLSSYDNIFLNENEFNKPPPELPPQIPVLLTQEASTSNTGPVPSFTHLELNHLYVHKSVDNQFVALRSTRRFRHKFVTSVLYKSL